MARLQMMDTAAALEAGRTDASNLITELCNLDGTTSPEQLFMESLSEVFALAIECRSAEASARLSGYAEMIAPMLADACDVSPEIDQADELATLHAKNEALTIKCNLYAAALKQADDAAIAQAQASGLGRMDIVHADSEGGEL